MKLLLLSLSAASSIFGSIQVGEAFFQTDTLDQAFAKSGSSDPSANATRYPKIAAPGLVSVTSEFTADVGGLYPLRSWMGGAILWATGKIEKQSPGGYFVAKNFQGTDWATDPFQQGPVIADPIILQYSDPPVKTGSVHDARGIMLSLPYPYLLPDTSYGPTCVAANSTWGTGSLALETDPVPTVLLYPANTPPVDGALSDDQIWGPIALLVDKMGDFSTDLIYQDPNNPYVRTPLSDPNGQGSYLKCTVVQGSPLVFCECRGASVLAVSNRITTHLPMQIPGTIVPATAPATVPTLTDVSYSMIGGNQIDPGQFAASKTLNPLPTPATGTPLQDNYTTWALYYRPSQATFTAATGTIQPQNSYFTITNPNQKFFFVLAGLPTIYLYPHNPIFPNYATAMMQTGYSVKNYAEELGKYVFNYVTDTKVSYQVQNQTFVDTDYTVTLTVPPFTGPSPVESNKTLLCLQPHHYQNQKFTSSLTPTVLNLLSSTPFSPTNTNKLFYWSVRGNLKAILGTQFQTRYIFTNFLHAMPPPHWTDEVTLTNSTDTTFAKTTIGQLLFDSIDNEYIDTLTDPAYAPWSTAYLSKNKGIYDVGKALSKSSKQLGLLAEFMNGMEENTSSSDPFYTFFWGGMDPTDFSKCSSYSNSIDPLTQVLYEQQYNNSPGKIDRPGAFNPKTFSPPVKNRITALRDALRSSVTGITSQPTNPPIYGLEGAIGTYFKNTPVVSTGGFNLSHFAYYDSNAHLVMLYPSAGDPTTPGMSAIPWPGQIQNPLSTYGVGAIFESFGVANAFNDHHYQYGFWISAAALAGLYDGTWQDFPNSGTNWIAPVRYGTAIDQLVMDLAYDPDRDSAFYKTPKMSFAKFNFFDRWAGHGWADGIQATIAGGNSGHNENSIGEALQAYASIALWGISTGRKEIADLGIYLYTTNSYAMDSYFFDKNLNLKKGQSPEISFVPVTTDPSNTTYPPGTAFIDATIHTSMSSGTPKVTQGLQLYSTDFGQTPENIKLINAFPCSTFSLVFGRNKDYLNAWNASLDTVAFNDTISLPLQVPTACWQPAFVSNMNMLRALGGNATAFGLKQGGPVSLSLTPYEYMLNLLTQWGGTTCPSCGCPPWEKFGTSFLDPCQSISEVLHFFHIIDHYGTPLWDVYAKSVPSGTYLFTAAFEKGGIKTAAAFNPGLTAVTVQFFDLANPGTSVSPQFIVKPKKWRVITLP